jgi:hypothetical protein
VKHKSEELKEGCYKCPNCQHRVLSEKELIDHFRSNPICHNHATELLKLIDIDYERYLFGDTTIRLRYDHE